MNLTQISDDFEFGIYPPANDELIKLRGGSLLKSIIDQMTLKLNCTNNPAYNQHDCPKQIPRKYYIYSAVIFFLFHFPMAKEGIVKHMIKTNIKESLCSADRLPTEIILSAAELFNASCDGFCNVLVQKAVKMKRMTIKTFAIYLHYF